jgi:hypothetical protein
MAALDTVLAKIDANLDSALGRLFKLVEIPSVSRPKKLPRRQSMRDAWCFPASKPCSASS